MISSFQFQEVAEKMEIELAAGTDAEAKEGTKTDSEVDKTAEDAKVKKEAEPKSAKDEKDAKDTSQKTIKRTRTSATPDAALKKAKVENGSSA